MRAQTRPVSVEETRAGRQRPGAAAARPPVRDLSPASVRNLQRTAGNEAVGLMVQRLRDPGATVQRTMTADPEIQPIVDAVEEMLGTARSLIATAQGLGFRLRGREGQQKHCDHLGTSLDTAEHMVYRQFRADGPAGRTANPRTGALKALLDEIQQRHIEYVGILRRFNLRPVGADIDPQDTAGLAQLSNTWSRVVGGQGIRTSSTPRPFGEDRTPQRLPGFENQMLSHHARLLSRQHGRNLVGGLNSGVAGAGAAMVGVVPFHPEQVEFMGGNSVVGAEAAVDTPEGLASAPNAPGRGSSSVVAVPHGMRDSEGAHEGEAVSPAFLVYGHELIHAQHNMHGINIRNVGDEEAATVTGNETSTALHRQRGVPVTTEEMLREEHGLPLRGGYT
ncbi:MULTISPECIES: M91 family zinc metallopeptidase [unclassified Streptomyces]|uniref:M91 family zinc metallopeptidase n=1 Tax=unclassified Streptomyces TaxID=2593676 RepID=UPI002E24DA48|nr:type III secretion system effector protein [Streptomyces sp. NBC_01023]